MCLQWVRCWAKDQGPSLDAPLLLPSSHSQ